MHVILGIVRRNPQERHRLHVYNRGSKPSCCLGHGRDRLGQALDVIGPTLQGQDTKPGSFSATVRRDDNGLTKSAFRLDTGSGSAQ